MSSAPLFLYLVKTDLSVGKHRYKLDHALECGSECKAKG